MSREQQTFFLVDGSHYDRLRSVFETPLDLKKLAQFASGGSPTSQLNYYRDARDDNEAERLRSLFGWLEHNGFSVKGRTHKKSEPRERYGTNLVQIAVDALLLAEPGDHVIVVAADAKLVPMFEALREYDIKVTLVSTLNAPDTIAPPSVLVEVADTFVDLASLVADLTVEKSGSK
ncbi:NYN domain-containing protein [Sinorhizobium medicae]|uniref:NYN domain-containing protein n=1 Tax=Sinorhizobium medicae TaxID=110321 RepID=A0ABX4TSK2_9HYPH|nr:NYN domain-containing protein [Sinorhizobium medicae]PLU08845.1 NYN domain-containing protein [Sinorhizobium medicae]PLU13008.1 NYN domain-containing protein [Sinorhizobium medicae]PLU78348.1 NYN domain-containing protein [Sinorhizobium medicae]